MKGKLVSTTQQGRRPTLRDIALEAGVSVPTVSKVVKGRPDVSPELRERIQNLLLDRGYESRGTQATGETTRAIELHFDSLSSTNNLEIMRGVIEAAEASSVDVVVKITPRNFPGTTWVESVSKAQHTGLILVTSRLDEDQQDAFADAGIPVVVIDPVNSPKPPIASVGVNNFMGGYLATKHLIALGHRDIAMIRGIASECANARLGGYHLALHEEGIASRSEYERQGRFRYEDGRAAAHELLTLECRPTAIFAANDLEALGTIDAARGLGLRVPDDLSVVGFDDSIEARSASPRLTTVRQPFAEIGSTALKILLQITAGERPTTHRLELATQLITRESTAHPPT